MKILVAGIGNIFFGDDGFGPEVLRRMATVRLPDGVRAVDYGIRGVHLAYELLNGWETLVLVDAIPNRGTPGRLHVFEADTAGAGAGQLDAHSMDPVAVLAGVTALGATPPRTIVVGCEVAETADGIALSPPVSEAVGRAVDSVTELIRTLTTV
ncbi:hydrogenase maturation protease [Skermania sp. ID1734]|uniref:hydrogenase maturation protease n=1 Tax=Skermania sp. ID1734 TaxID=2597516 RepID=UPI001180E0AF|nr:hydrogenase maturation protease [Skermania sp. ID1734]TSE01246.1 hydrogenase maturation protease [Skermania sp. ID1734]